MTGAHTRRQPSGDRPQATGDLADDGVFGRRVRSRLPLHRRTPLRRQQRSENGQRVIEHLPSVDADIMHLSRSFQKSCCFTGSETSGCVRHTRLGQTRASSRDSELRLVTHMAVLQHLDATPAAVLPRLGCPRAVPLGAVPHPEAHSARAPGRSLVPQRLGCSWVCTSSMDRALDQHGPAAGPTDVPKWGICAGQRRFRGGGGIRTHETAEPPTGFQDRRLRPDSATPPGSR
jgi:hypothetical protein